MRKQLSIVLVEGDHVPRELSGLLVGMGVWVKSTWSTGLDEALAQTTPHLVVCGDPSQLPLLKRTISQLHPGTPLLLIADWDLTRAQRAVASGLVEDLIPDSLPAADIARRLESLAARRATRMPSRATLTPPTRAGIHPLLSVSVGREDRTPESRQDNPVPSRRPPPLPVRVVSHAPAWPADTATRSVQPTAAPSSIPPPFTRPAKAHSVAPRPSTSPMWPPSSLAPLTASVHPAYAPRPPPSQQPAPSSYRPPAPPQASWAQASWAQARPAPASVPPSAVSPAALSPAALSPDSAPPIQMLTTTVGRRSRRPRRSGPGFTLGAALGVAASAAAFVGVIEFEQDLRLLASKSAVRVQGFLGEHDSELPTWLESITKYIPGRGHTAKGTPRAASLASKQAPATPAAAASGAAPSGAGPTALPGVAEGAPIELEDLGTIETGALGMSQSEAEALFKVEDSRLASCEEILAGWEPPLPMIEEDRPKHGATHRRRGQDQLVIGEPQKALQDLCKSAKIDPAGLGTETLASVYLSLRSLEHAEHWIKRFLADNARSDSGRELLADIENQRGRVAEARAVWLAVLRVDSDADGRMREVAKHWVQDAASALGASDLAQAERKLRRALALDPYNTTAALLMSRVLERQGLVTPSLAWAKRARELAR